MDNKLIIFAIQIQIRIKNSKIMAITGAINAEINKYKNRSIKLVLVLEY